MGVGEEKQNLEAQALGENVYWLVGTVDNNNNNNNNNNNCLLFKGFSKDCCGHKVNHCSSYPDLVAWGELRMEKNRLLAIKPSATWMVNK